MGKSYFLKPKAWQNLENNFWLILIKMIKQKIKLFKKTFFGSKLWLVAIFVVLAFILRFVGQPNIPTGFHRDEAGIAYSAYSILKTGRDEWGSLLPLHFKALGDYPPGVYNYITVFFTVFLGPGEIAERMPAIVFGSLLVLLAYQFIKKYFDNEKLALVTAFIIAISPWDIVQSRSGSEPIVALFFSLLSWNLFSDWIKKKKLSLFTFSLVSGLLAVFTYNSSRVFLPLFQFVLIWFFFYSEKHKKIFKNTCALESKKQKIIAIIGAFIFLFISLGAVFQSSESSMRFNEVSIFGKESTSEQDFAAFYIREGINKIPLIASRAFHNKVFALLETILFNYSQYFGISFLFFSGGFPRRYMIPNSGLLLQIALPFLIIGLMRSRFSKKRFLLILAWVVLAPIAGAITIEDIPHVKRVMYLFMPLHILTGIGLIHVFNSLKKKYLKIMFSFLILFGLIWSTTYFANQYLIHSKYETVNYRSYGYKETFLYVNSIEDQYDAIIVYENNDAAHVYYLLYSKYSPKEYQKIAHTNPSNLFRPEKEKKSWKINKVLFEPGACPGVGELYSGSLYATRASCASDLDKHVTVLHTVFLPSGLPKFSIFIRDDNYVPKIEK